MKAEQPQDELDLLHLLYVELEPAIQITFLDAAGVAHEKGVMPEQLEPPFADEAAVRLAAARGHGATWSGRRALSAHAGAVQRRGLARHRNWWSSSSTRNPLELIAIMTLLSQALSRRRRSRRLARGPARRAVGASRRVVRSEHRAHLAARHGQLARPAARAGAVRLGRSAPHRRARAILAASDWAINQYKSWGIDAKRENYGTWRGWRRGTSHIDLVSPRVRSLDGTMLAWSPGTNGKPVNAEAIVLPKFNDSTEFVKWLPQGEGQDRDGLAGVADLPSVGGLVPLVDAGVDGAHGHARSREMQRDWSVMTGPTASPDSTKLYRGTGYSLALGTGTLGMRLEKAGVLGDDLVAPEARRLPESVRAGRAAAAAVAAAAGAAARRARRRRAITAAGPRRASPRRLVGRGGANAPQGTGGWGTTEIFETYNTVAPAVTLDCEDYGLVFRLAENKQKPMRAARPRRAAPRRAAGVQHHRDDQGHRRSRTST